MVVGARVITIRQALQPRLYGRPHVNGRQGKRTHLLPTETSIVLRNELVSRGARGVTNGASESRPHAEVHVESARARPPGVCPHMDMQLSGELIKQ